MKTLYININGKNVVSNDEIVVVGTEKDIIVNKFYIALGKEICDGVILKCVKKKQLVADFESERPKDFKPILDQWDEIRCKLLSSDPSGTYSVKIPNTYLEWLQYHQNAEYRKIYTQKFSDQRDVSVKLDIEQLYDDAIELIISNIESRSDYDKLVVNDEFVTSKSTVVKSIKNAHPQILFVPFEDIVCLKCGKFPCECKQKSVCPKCGKSPCECITEPPVYLRNPIALECSKCEENLCVVKIARRNYTNENQNELLENDTEYDKEFSYDEVRKLERFFPQYKGGLDYIGKSGEDYLLYGYKHEQRERNNADVVTNQGKVLFALKKEDGIVVTSVLPSGLLLIEKSEDDDTSCYGIACKHGKILVPCEEGEHKNITSKNFRELRFRNKIVIEKIPGVIKFLNEKYYINAYTREQYIDVVGDYGLKIKSENNDSLIDVVNIKTGEIITTDVTIDNEPGLREIENGWYIIKVLKRNEKGWVNKVPMVFNEENLLFLDEMETILNYGSSFFINNDRMITVVGHIIDTWRGWCDFSEIRIRDYSGNIITTIATPHLFISDPYNYGKLAAFKIGEDGIAQSLVYFDMKGEEHCISYNVEHFHYSNLRAFFVSDKELEFINGKSRKRTCILKINENITK